MAGGDHSQTIKRNLSVVGVRAFRPRVPESPGAWLLADAGDGPAFGLGETALEIGAERLDRLLVAEQGGEPISPTTVRTIAFPPPSCERP